MEFGARIRLAANIKTKRPNLRAFSSNFLASKFQEAFGYPCVMSAYQSNIWSHSLFSTTSNLLASTSYSVVATPAVFSAYQNNTWDNVIWAQTSNLLFGKANGYIEGLSRVYIEAKDDVQYSTHKTRISTNVQYKRASMGDQEALIDSDQPISTTDSVYVVNWRGTGVGKNDYVYIEYQKDGGEWKDILESINIVIAPEFATPTFFWSEAENLEENETATYELVIAYDYQLKNVAQKISTSELSCQSDNLKTGITYFWSVRALDSNGAYSDWAPVKSFQTLPSQPSYVKNIGGTNRILIPFKDYSYAWYVGNLSDGIYNYSITKYSNGSISTIVPRGSAHFIVDHTGTNLPQVMNIEYDAQKYLLKFDIKIFDSYFRKYNLKKIQYADERTKFLGASSPTFSIGSHSWHTIPLAELTGRKSALESSPYIESKATMVWSFSGVKDPSKKYRYNLLVASEENAETRDFKWAYRIDGGGWVVSTFDYDDHSYWTRSVSSKPSEKSLYYGKANPFGIVMNRTKFSFAQDGDYDFRIFYEDIEQPLIAKSASGSSVIITPKEFYDAGITNIVLDLIGIETEQYDLYPAEISKIISQVGKMDFFWQVQTNDGIELSNWSKATKSKDFNIHHFEWDVRNNLDFTPSDFYLLKAEVDLAAEFKNFEYPKFSWMGSINTKIRQYYGQIDRITSEYLGEDADPTVKGFYQKYVDYLKQRVYDIRLEMYNDLLQKGIIQQNASNYFTANVHNGRVETSDLDFAFSSIDSEVEINTESWSTAFDRFRLDPKETFDSQEGKPLREYSAIGKTCKNTAYSKCFLTTGSTTSCKWMGILCPGIKYYASGVLFGNQSITQNGVTVEFARMTDEMRKEIFDPGQCPMANGGPCAKYNTLEYDAHTKNCEVCGDPRYYEFIPVHNEGGTGGEETYSRINPAGYKDVAVFTSTGATVDPNAKIFAADQVRNQQAKFSSFELIKAQLPGELNSDILNSTDERPIYNSYFTDRTIAQASGNDFGHERLNKWYSSPKPSGAKLNITEII